MHFILSISTTLTNEAFKPLVYLPDILMPQKSNQYFIIQVKNVHVKHVIVPQAFNVTKHQNWNLWNTSHTTIISLCFRENRSHYAANCLREKVCRLEILYFTNLDYKFEKFD